MCLSHSGNNTSVKIVQRILISGAKIVFPLRPTCLFAALISRALSLLFDFTFEKSLPRLAPSLLARCVHNNKPTTNIISELRIFSYQEKNISANHMMNGAFVLGNILS